MTVSDYVNVVSSIVANVGDVDNEAAWAGRGQGVYDNSLYLALNCTVNLKLFLEYTLQIWKIYSGISVLPFIVTEKFRKQQKEQS